MRHVLYRTSAFVLAVLMSPSPAFAAGTEIPENGASVAGRGGTSIGLLDTAYSLQFNPAGMSRVKGLDVRVDMRLVSSKTSFLREPTEDLTFRKVSNTDSPRPVPMAMAVYSPPVEGILGRFSFGLGVWAAPGVWTTTFPDFRDAPGYAEEPDENYAEYAGQRYATIKSENIIVYPSVGLSFKILDNLSAGVTFQAAYANLKSTQALNTLGDASFLFGDHEDTRTDAIVSLDFEDAFTPTAVFGLAYNPIPALTLGVGFRPKIDYRAAGPMEVTLPESISDLAEVTSEDPRAKLAISFPAVTRAGVAYQWRGLRVGGEFIYEHWSSNKQFKVTPEIEMTSSVVEIGEMEPLDLPKHWKNTYGGRLGASYEVLPVERNKLSLDVFGGALFETNAIPSKYQSVDFVTGDRLGFSAGATVGWDRFGLTASFLGYVPAELTVSDSELTRSTAMPEKDPVIIGNGTYTSNVWVFSLGLIYRDFNLGG